MESANQPQYPVLSCWDQCANAWVDAVPPIMASAQPEPSRLHPRRRPILNTELPTLSTDSVESEMRLKKGETFHTPTSPPSSDSDPVLNLRSLPRRSPTSLEAITAAEERMTSILGRLSLNTTEDKQKGSGSTVPDTMRRNSNSMSNLGSSNEEKKTEQEQDHSHDSDSGLGSSVSSEEELSDSNSKGRLTHCSCIVPSLRFRALTNSR